MHLGANNWAFSWVQIMAHHKKMLWGLLTLMLLGVASGVLQADYSVAILHSVPSQLSSHNPVFGLFAAVNGLQLFAIGWGTSVLLMSLLFAWQAESLKSGVILFAVLGLVTLLTLGLSAWFDVQIGQLEGFAIIVALTLVTANMVHLLSTLHREMARGLFQYDAVAEAIKLNHSPIFLSNLTTALGVAFTAWLYPEWQDFSVVLSIGVFFSYLLSITLIPLLLLSWLLEFRVGNSRDRHSLYQYIQSLEKISQRKSVRWLTFGSLLLATCAAIWSLSVNPLQLSLVMFERLLENTAWLVGSFAVLFILWWRQIGWAVIAVILLSLSILFAMSLLLTFVPMPTSSLTVSHLLLLLVAPIGIIVDDLIHFFARYRRAKMTVFSQGLDSVRFAMVSVGRPILITSLLLGSAMLVIIGLAMIYDQTFVLFLASMVLVGIVFLTLLLLFVLPIWLMNL